MATWSVSLVLLLAALIGQGNACVHLMGQALDSVAPKPAGTSWTYGFKGDDWKGVDATNKPWICQTGKKQSPLNLHGLDTTSKSPSALRTTWEYQPMKSNGSNIQVYNNGHTIQIQWAPGTLTSNVRVQTKGQTATDVLSMGEEDVKSMKTATATPLQFHFHSDSEHTVEGHFAPLEMHIVHSIPQSQVSGCPATGCLMVTGMTFKLSEDGKDNAYLKDIFDAMPTREGVMTDLAPGKTVDLQKLLPSDQTYAQYEGSLTTPPCTEGLLWHVFTEPVPISLKQLKQYATAVGLKECKLKKGAKGGRSLRAGEEDAEVPATNNFERGSYSGFTYVSHVHLGRSLLAAAANPDKYVCTIKSVGQTNRWPQPLNGRTVKVF